ncbi:mitochondrial protein C2orf69 isoform X3 [Panulirus ornatus]
MSGNTEATKTIRFGAVSTPSGLSNELIYAPPAVPQTTSASPVLVFFGGDVQNYPEVMAAHRDHKHYIEWSLTRTAALLATKFPAHHIFIVKPNRMERKTFSCFDNFVLSNSVGAPTHEPGYEAIVHLAALISRGLKIAQREWRNDNTYSSHHFSEGNNVGILPHPLFQSCQQDKEVPELQECTIEEASASSTHYFSNQKPNESEVKFDDVTLIGFSKGCVVLNQLVTEFHAISSFRKLEDRVPMDFIRKVHHMYWLDGGHSGGSNTWITSSAILKSFAALKHINIHIHVTPYQVQDEHRPWIRKECKKFYDTLHRIGAKVSYTLHFEDEPASLMTHFRILNEFT